MMKIEKLIEICTKEKDLKARVRDLENLLLQAKGLDGKEFFCGRWEICLDDDEGPQVHDYGLDIVEMIGFIDRVLSLYKIRLQEIQDKLNNIRIVKDTPFEGSNAKDF